VRMSWEKCHISMGTEAPSDAARRLAELEDRIETLEREKMQAQLQMSQLRDTHVRSSAEIKTLTARCEQLRHAAEEADERLAARSHEQQRELKALHDTIATMKQHSEAAKAKESKLTGRLQQLEQQLLSSEQQAQERESEQHGVRRECERLKDANQGLESKVKKLTQQLADKNAVIEERQVPYRVLIVDRDSDRALTRALESTGPSDAAA